jgi:hypothetical protein
MMGMGGSKSNEELKGPELNEGQVAALDGDNQQD